jgi:hypothetical protein
MGFITPESIYHDTHSDVYLVSNINGAPTTKDNNGFISRLSPTGELLSLKWIEGGKNGIMLHAPKGMATIHGLLYVADIDVIRIFDSTTGVMKGIVRIPNASFLNDLSSLPGDRLFISDTGWRSGKRGFENSGTDSVWLIERGAVKQLAEGESLHNPNGLWATEDTLLMVNGKGELFEISPNGEYKRKILSLPSGGLDGIVQTADGLLLISSWKAQAVFAGTAETGFQPIIENIVSPADIGYDASRNQLLIPVFQKDAIRIVPLSKQSKMEQPAK